MNKKGFTLLELLTVISIISMLANSAFAVAHTARVKARDAVRLANLKTLSTGLELYYIEFNKYPDKLGSGSFGSTLGSSSNFATLDGVGVTCLDSSGLQTSAGCNNEPIWIKTIPPDPSLPVDATTFVNAVEYSCNWRWTQLNFRDEPCYNGYRALVSGTDGYIITFFMESDTEIGPRGYHQLRKGGLFTLLLAT